MFVDYGKRDLRIQVDERQRMTILEEGRRKEEHIWNGSF